VALATERSDVVFTASGAVYTVHGKAITYWKVGGIYYRAEAPDVVVRALEEARSRQRRVRLYYGDRDGRDWLEEHHVEGFIGNSMGPLKVPLLIRNRRALDGPALLDHCIVKLKWTKGGVLYQHPLYHTGVFTIRLIGPDEMCGGKNLRSLGYTHAVDVDNQNRANFRSARAAERYVQRMSS
jgi:hypothetical protein